MELSSLSYPAVAVGLLLEGEVSLLAASLAANLGYLEIGVVLVMAVVASFTSDQTCFWLGRCAGPRLMQRYPRLAAGIERIRPVIERHPTKLVVSIRFLFGLRTVGPIAMGMTPASTLSAPRFLFLSLVGAIVWAAIGGAIGYFFGAAVRWLITDGEHWPFAIPVLLLASAGAVWMVRARKVRA